MAEQGATCSDGVDIVADGLFATITNANFDADSLNVMKEIAMAKYADKRPARTLIADNLFHDNANMILLRSTLAKGLLFGGGRRPCRDLRRSARCVWLLWGKICPGAGRVCGLQEPLR